MKTKRIIKDIKTGKVIVLEKEFIPQVSQPEPEGLNIQDAVNLVKYAKLHGWIK